jgi:putative two-component system response regulator
VDKQTVLVVDDAPENIDLVVGILKEQYTVKAARNGQVALKIARSPNPPALILLDIVMPDMDGFEVCHELKADLATAVIPVIFLSGEIGAEERRRGTELGAVDYLTKPVDPAKLSVAIESALAAARD